MKANPYPFAITIDDDADGGPAHLLWLLRTYIVSFRLRNEEIARGEIIDVDDTFVTVAQWDEATGLHDGERIKLQIWDAFDEVRYL